MACNLKHIKRSSQDCTESYSGIGTSVYVAFVEDLETPVEYSETLAGFDPETSFKFKSGQGFYQLDIKKKSGKVTAESNGQGKGFTNVLTFVMNQNMDDMALISRAINNVDTLWAAADGKGGYYMIYDKNFAPEVAISADTGDAPDSDNGFTVTVTGTPMRYPLPKFTGVLTLEEDEAGE
jgi:hypothetical protein